MNKTEAPTLTGAERRKLREAQQEADREAIKTALLSVIRNPAARPSDVVKAAELLQKGFFERGNRWAGGGH